MMALDIERLYTKRQILKNVYELRFSRCGLVWI